MEDNITFNTDICKKCGLCAEVCPNKIILKDNNRGIMTLRPDRGHLCFQCGQCMSICPVKSINIKGLSYKKDFFDLPEEDSYENTFFNMLYTRRAIRNFQDKPVPKDLLEKIIQAISFAPPSFPPLKTRIIVVQDSNLIMKALPHMVEFYDYFVKAMGNPVMRFFIKKEVGKQKFKTMKNHLLPLLKAKLPEMKSGTEDAITRHAPAMILFLADSNDEDIMADIYIAATYGFLAAHSLGLGGSVMDIIPPAIERKAELRKLFSIPDNCNVVASIIVGYPKYKYQRGIKRGLKNVEWL
ncbi:MAG: nitroreductase family protein [Proteobacteria bacterium]|nr:nitroreductase family protein [Pseudomonadota bacterium]